jgi:ring-1,2-phenylacetyl-CoA epoxidase subunit PaaC
VTAASPAVSGGWLDAVGAPAVTPLADYAMRLGDDALVLAQRTAEWVAKAPELEEDVALANIALDLLGQARALLSYAGRVEGRGRDEDALAYLRVERELRCCQLVELPNGDFAQTMARLLAFSTYSLALYEGLTRSSDEVLAAVAAKAVKEVAYHRDHATQWVLRLGDGTEESARRMRAGLATVWPYVDELFEVDPLVRDLVAAGAAVDPAGLRPGWQAYVDDVLVRARLERPAPGRSATGGRKGVHTEHLGLLLAELQHVARAHPGARW